jgi:hypothetical protein
MKKLVSLVLILALVLAMATPLAAMAAGTGSSSGTYTANNVAPTVGSVVLYTTGGSPAPTTAMSPQVEYNVKVTVTDANELSDLTNVRVTIFYADSTPTFSGDVPGSGNTHTAAILTCSGAGATPTWSIEPSTNSSWSIINANCVQPTPLTATTGTFEFHFKPGKVATTATGKWYIYTEVTDSEPSSGTAHQDNLDMNWYGEVTGVTGTVGFGSIDLGSNDNQSIAPVSVTYISNGNYKEQIKTDDGTGPAQWKQGSIVVGLVSSGTPGAGQMRLKGSYDATLGHSLIVTAGYLDLIADGTITADTGSTRGANTLWLSLGGSGIPKGVYTGTIYYNISTR